MQFPLRQVLCVSAAFLGTCLLTAAQAASPDREVLPDTVVPSHYDLAIRPDLTAMTFAGTNAATVTVKSPTREIVLNADGLVLDRAALETGAVGKVSYDAARGRATIRFPAAIAAGEHRLSIDYHGQIGRETIGLFAMDYDTAGGKRRTLATSLEPVGARKVFPGWDEPAIKATYTLTLDAPADRMALSNMPAVNTVHLSPTMNRVTFARSPRMSSYLFFLGIGDWERIATRIDGVDVGVVVNRGQAERGRYALGEAAKVLHWYNGYFGVPYPLPKLDLIAAPGQLSAGSMENWGAILYSQDQLLFDPATSSEPERQWVFTVVAHEMAHQWFGNLVTMAWWSDLWLNEGFARWMQAYVADALHPDWKMGLRAQATFEAGKAADALSSTHPVVQDIQTANQASQAFDNITYDKGAAVVSMLATAAGDDAFRAGVQAYMRAHAYGNTVDADFWTTMGTVSGRPVLATERDFTRQAGLPLVRVTSSADSLRLSEDRFTIAGPTATASSTQWRMPLTVRSGGADSRITLPTSASVAAGGPTLVNVGQSTYARTLYDPRSLAALLPGIPAMASVDQIGLVQDALALARAGYTSGADLMSLIDRVPATAGPVVWQRIADALTAVDRTYGERPGRAAFRRYAVGVLNPALAAIGAIPQANEPGDRPEARETLTKTLGAFGDPAVVARARALLDGDGGTADERQTALLLVAAKADTAAFDALLAKARATKDPLDKQQLYHALGGVEDEALARRMAAIAVSNEVPAGSNLAVIAPLWRAHPALVWAEIVPHLADPSLGMDPDLRRYVASQTAAVLDDPALVPAVLDYAERNVPADVRTPFTGAAAAIDVNHRTATRMLPEINHWVAAR